MRFRHKLSIVLVGLAIIPLAATGVLIAALLEHDQVTRVDNRVAVSAASAAQVYRGELPRANAFANQLARTKAVKLAFATGQSPPKTLPLHVPPGMTVTLVRAHGKPLYGNPPVGPAWKTTANYVDAANGKEIGDVNVYVRLGPPVLRQILDGTSQPDNVGLALVAGSKAVASSNNVVGPVSGLRAGAGYATVAG